jgi:hypothetical protein
MPGENLAEDIHQFDQGPLALSRDKPVATLKGLFNFQPDRPLTRRQDHDPFNVMVRSNGGDVLRSSGGLYQVETDGTTTAQAELATAQLGVYRPGTLANWATGVWIDVDPAGTDAFYDVGYGGRGFSEGLFFRILGEESIEFRIQSERYQEDVVLGRNLWERDTVTEITDGGEVVGTMYGIDAWLGGRKSGGLFQASRGHLFGSIVGWYGPSSIMPYVVEVGDVNGTWVQKVWPLFLYRPVHGPAIENPNLPLRITAQNNGSAQTLQARIGGRQFSYRGDVPLSPQPTHHWSKIQDIPMDGSGTGERDWYVVAVLRRKQSAEFKSTALGMDDFRVTSGTEPMAYHARTIPESLLSGTIEYDEPVDTHAQQTAIEVDCAADTPDRVTVDEAQIDGSTKLEGIKWQGNIAGSNVSDQVGAAGTATKAANVGFGFPIVRGEPTVIVAATRSGNSDKVTTSFTLEEAG